MMFLKMKAISAERDDEIRNSRDVKLNNDKNNNNDDDDDGDVLGNG